MKVLKFGGTSVGNAERMKNVLDIVEQQRLKSDKSSNEKKSQILVVLSAVAGTTDRLVSLAKCIKASDLELAKSEISQLRSIFSDFISDLFSEQDSIEKATVYVNRILVEFESLLLNKDLLTENEILSKGEFVSTKFFKLYVDEKKVACERLNSLEFLKQDSSNEPDKMFLKSSLNSIIRNFPNKKIFIAQGFICCDKDDKVSNLKRGGSDYSASLFAEAIESEELQIWTDIDGMHNNDPRYVKGTKTIRYISFNEAAELAYFGAKILHPSSIKPARKSNTPVRLLNTLQPSAVGTLISTKSERKIVKAVAAKGGITAIKIRSSEMLEARGFLKKIFEVFEEKKTSIDMITTSEVAVSVTVDDITYLDKIIDELSTFSSVEIDSNLSIISVVGEYLIENQTVVSKVTESLKSIPIRMISYGGSPHNISLLVASDEKNTALNLLQSGLFESS